MDLPFAAFRPGDKQPQTWVEIGAASYGARRDEAARLHSDAASAGFYVSPVMGEQKFPRVQLLTVGELLQGARIQYPPQSSVTFKAAPRARRKGHKEKNLFEG